MSRRNHAAPYRVVSLDDDRKGERKHEMMSAVQPLTDQDVADLAAHYAGIRIEANP